MADPQQVDEEFGRRLAAARGYSRAPSAQAWAKRIGVDRSTLRRYELGKIDPTKRAWAIDQCVRQTGLPRHFFTINLDDLPEMVAAWRQIQEKDAGQLQAELEQDERDFRQDGPSDLPPEGRDRGAPDQ